MNRPAGSHPASRRTSGVVSLLVLIPACTVAYLAGHGAANLGANGLLAVAIAITVFVFTRSILTRSNARAAHHRHSRH